MYPRRSLSVLALGAVLVTPSAAVAHGRSSVDRERAGRGRRRRRDPAAAGRVPVGGRHPDLAGVEGGPDRARRGHAGGPGAGSTSASTRGTRRSSRSRRTTISLWAVPVDRVPGRHRLGDLVGAVRGPGFSGPAGLGDRLGLYAPHPVDLGGIDARDDHLAAEVAAASGFPRAPSASAPVADVGRQALPIACPSALDLPRRPRHNGAPT